MKTFKLIGLGLLAVLLSFTFAACGGDEEEDGTNDGPGNEQPETGVTKRLKQYSYTETSGEDAGYSYVMTFKYDEAGKIERIEKHTSDNYESWSREYDYYWDGNTIEEYNDDYHQLTYRIGATDDLVSSATYNGYGDNAKILFTYNSSKQLTSYSERMYDETDKCSFNWNGDKVIELREEESGHPEYNSSIKFTYGNQKCSGYYPNAGEFVDFSPITLVHPELFGCKIKSLPTKANYFYDIYGEVGVINFTHELDQDGYVIKLKGNGWMYNEEDLEKHELNYEYNYVWE